MNLVVDEMMELEHVNAANRHTIFKRLSRASVVEDCLAILGQPCSTNRTKHFGVTRTVKDGRRDVDTRDVRLRHAMRLDIVADRAQALTHRRVARLDLHTEGAHRHAQMCFQDLSDVHA